MFYTDELELIDKVNELENRFKYYDNIIPNQAGKILNLETRLAQLQKQFKTHQHKGDDIVCPQNLNGNYIIETIKEK